MVWGEGREGRWVGWESVGIRISKEEWLVGEGVEIGGEVLEVRRDMVERFVESVEVVIRE